MTFVLRQKINQVLESKEKKVLSAILAGISIFTIIDVIEDWIEGSSIYHILPEVLIVVVTTVASVYFFLRFASSKKDVIELSREQAKEALASATVWQGKATALKVGLSEAISAQLKDWNLTEAEQEIAFLLIKGLSIGEIAEIRNTSAQTTRQQASTIYKKSQLEGRAQLSAFFLEDLLVNLDRPKGG
jgi:DNA-binding NarL/FixJ family response regulator